MVHIIRDIRQHIEFVNSAVSTKLPRPTLSSQLTEWKEYIKRVVEPAQYMNPKIHDYARNRQVKHKNQSRVRLNRRSRNQPARNAGGI